MIEETVSGAAVVRVDLAAGLKNDGEFRGTDINANTAYVREGYEKITSVSERLDSSTTIAC